MRSVVLGLFTLASFAQEANPLANNAEAAETGRELFLGACSACHGASGQGGTGPNLITGRATNRMQDRQLFRSIKDGVPGTDMPPFGISDEKVWQLVTFVRSLSAPAIKARLKGDPAKGQALFSGKGGCVGCHAIAGKGGVLGPDLSNAGVNRTVLQLRESIFDPNARIEAGFEAAAVTTKAGESIAGVLKNANNYSVQLLDNQGRLHLFWMRDLTAMKRREGSLMPAGFDTKLTKQESEDLLAFLSKQTIRPGVAQ
jgi:putative heme-binding domain-containing protein